MESNLQTELYNKYPKLFDVELIWGIETGDGWYNLINSLCDSIQFDIDNNRQPQIKITQIKEKFGLLRFYTNTVTERQVGMISFAEKLSGLICEKCGSTDNVQFTKTNWIKSYCSKCRLNYK